MRSVAFVALLSLLGALLLCLVSLKDTHSPVCFRARSTALLTPSSSTLSVTLSSTSLLTALPGSLNNAQMNATKPRTRRLTIKSRRIKLQQYKRLKRTEVETTGGSCRE
ncbi:hypothetical protein ACLKA6_003263 [Drosophila palustris]